MKPLAPAQGCLLGMILGASLWLFLAAIGWMVTT